MEGKKEWYKSETIMGAIGGIAVNVVYAVAQYVLPALGVDIQIQFDEKVLLGLNALIGAIIIHGRKTAKTEIK